jgi:hypothetical protein
MDDLREAPYWAELLSRLRDEPLDAIAAAYGLEPRALERALAGEPEAGAAERAPWWPEAARRVGGGRPVREVARRFGTNPRRLRRALARAGLRVGGQDVRTEGVPALAPLRDRLGRSPDATVAARAKVIIEAVAGERRRLGISAYNPRKAKKRGPPRLVRPARPPRPPPRKPLRPRAWLDDAAPQVIRRPGAGPRLREPEVSLPPGADPPAAPRPSLGALPPAPAPLPPEADAPARPPGRVRMVRKPPPGSDPGPKGR